MYLELQRFENKANDKRLISALDSVELSASRPGRFTHV
jgi:hypothetical protein